MSTKDIKHLSVLGLIGVLLAYFQQGGNAVLNGAIPNIVGALNISPETAGQVGTVGALFAVIAGLLVGRLAGSAIKYKTFLVVSLLISIAGGACPAVISTWPAILFSRACVGFGVGVFFAVPPVLIMRYYEGEEQRKKIGLASVFASAGGGVMVLIVGVLANVQWNFVFWVYALGILALIPVLLALKEPEKAAAPSDASGQQQKEKLSVPVPVILNFVLMFIGGIFGMCGYIFNSVIIDVRGLGSNIEIAVVQMMFNVSAVILSFFFAPLYKIFKRFLAIIILLVVLIGSILVHYSSSLVMSAVGIFLIGTFLLIIPTLLTDNVQWNLNPATMTFAASFLGVVMNLGNFVMGPYMQFAGSIADESIFMPPLFFSLFGLGATIVIFFVIRLVQKPPAAA